MKTASLLAAIVGLVCLWVGAAQAGLVAYEGFDYAVHGPTSANEFGSYGLTNCGHTSDLGFDGSDGVGGDALYANGWDNYITYNQAVQGTTYISAYPAGTNGPATVGNVGAGVSSVYSVDRQFNQPIGDAEGAATRYFSFLHNAYAGTSSYSVLVLGGGGGYAAIIGGWGDGYKPSGGYENIGWSLDQPYGENTTHLWVCKIEFTGDDDPDRLTLWMDPNIAAGEAGNTPMTVQTTVNAGTYTGVWMYGACAAAYDEIKVGTEWGDVMATPEPATLGLLAMGGVAVLIRRNRK